MRFRLSLFEVFFEGLEPQFTFFTFPGLVIEVRQIFAAATPLGFTIGAQRDLQRIGFLVQLAFHVAAQIEVAAMGNPFELAEFTGWQEGESVLDICGSG